MNLKIKKKTLLIDQHDKNFMYGGKYGGNYIPETLKKPIDDLTKLFSRLRKDKKFLKALSKKDDPDNVVVVIGEDNKSMAFVLPGDDVIQEWKMHAEDVCRAQGVPIPKLSPQLFPPGLERRRQT